MVFRWVFPHAMLKFWKPSSPLCSQGAWIFPNACTCWFDTSKGLFRDFHLVFPCHILGFENPKFLFVVEGHVFSQHWSNDSLERDCLWLKNLETIIGSVLDHWYVCINLQGKLESLSLGGLWLMSLIYRTSLLLDSTISVSKLMKTQQCISSGCQIAEGHMIEWRFIRTNCHLFDLKPETQRRCYNRSKKVSKIVPAENVPPIFCHFKKP